MDSKYTKRLTDAFPQTFGFVSNPSDPIYQLLNSGGYMISKALIEKTEDSDNLTINNVDPNLATKSYYIEFPKLVTMDKVTVTPLTNTIVNITTNDNDFMYNSVTGFEFVEDIVPVGLPSADMIGICNGFDWDAPEYYITVSGSEYVYKYTDGFENNPEFVSYGTLVNSYQYNGYDEVIKIEYEFVTSDDILPPLLTTKMNIMKNGQSGVVDLANNKINITSKLEHGTKVRVTGSVPAPLQYNTDYYVIYVSDTSIRLTAIKGGTAITITQDGGFTIVQVLDEYKIMAKVGYLNNIPVETTIKIIDMYNMQNPNYDDSDGIIVKSTDYSVNSNKIIFDIERSDYNPETTVEIGGGLKYIQYPDDWQPDKGFNSTYVAEYNYKIANPKYIDMIGKSHDISLKGTPFASH